MSENETKTIHDPANYRAMSEPYNSRATAMEAMEAFYNDVREARQRHRIADVVLVIRSTYGPNETPLIHTAHMGDELKELPMVHFALANAENSVSEMIERIRKSVARVGS